MGKRDPDLAVWRPALTIGEFSMEELEARRGVRLEELAQHRARVAALERLSPAELGAVIRERRADLDRRIASGEVKAPKPLTYTKPRGPSIVGGPAGARGEWGR
ncbi:MAG: hypothetical protein ACREIL_09845 [Nitrospiraceae bacterium]